MEIQCNHSGYFILFIRNRMHSHIRTISFNQATVPEVGVINSVSLMR